MNIKRIILLSVVTVFLAGVLSTVFSVQTGIASSFVFFLSGLGILHFNQLIISSTTSSIQFNDNRRNFDYLLFGSTYIWKYFPRDKINTGKNNKIKSFAFFKRSLYASYLILQRTFSYLKKGGTVIVTIDFGELNTTASDKMQFTDLLMLHPVTLGMVNAKFTKWHKMFPFIFYPFSSILYCYHLTKKNRIKSASTECNFMVPPPAAGSNNSNTHIKYIAGLIESIAGFNSERGLKTTIVCIVTDCWSELAIKKLAKTLNLQDSKLPIISIKEINELESLIR